MPFASGENVGAYRIVEKLGQGGMATVYKAYHPALDRYVAIKVMHPAFTEDPNFLARFQREARIVAKLDHPHIIPIYDFAEHKGHPYLVMRFVEGETLKAHVEHTPLEPPEILRIARAVGDALTYAHGQGVLHRDIKPSNILLTPEGDRPSGGGIYLTDFGLARMAEAGESTLSRDMMVGTPQYISPEQAKGLRELDARTDIYSLGVVLYELLVGRAPFTADTPYAIVHDHIFTPLPLPREINPDLPEPIERVLLKALAKEPDDRFQDVGSLIAALETAIQAAAPPPVAAEPSVASPPTEIGPAHAEELAKAKKPVRKKRRWPWIVAVAAVLCIGIFLCTFIGVPWLRQRQQRQQAQQTASAAPGQNAEELLEAARAARAENNLGDALDLYQQAAEADPQLIPAYMEASELQMKQGDANGAINTLQRGVETNPENLELHAALAELTLFTERWDLAQREAEWFLRETPEQAFAHAYAAAIPLKQGEPCEKARPELSVAVEIDPESPWTHYALGLCHRQEGDMGAARGELETVLGHPEASPYLKKEAEETLEKLEAPPAETLEAQFEIVLKISAEIPNDELRNELKNRLEQAQRAWKEGNQEEAIRTLEETIPWVEENQAEIGPARARLLIGALQRIINMAQKPPPP